MRFLVPLIVLVAGLVQAQVSSDSLQYLNPDLPVDRRADDLVSRMTLAEKVSQMVNASESIPRLRIPEYNWWNECLHGVARAGVATVFPQAIGLAATWDTALMFRVADVISTEARAKNNDFLRRGDRGIFKGLTFWSPNINIFRDPRWGRGQETYGEDPYLTGRLGVAFVRGLQGSDPRYFKVIATPKHFAVHSGPEPERHQFNAVIDKRDLYGTYLPAFEACVKEGGAFSVMCAYNRFMGDACCGSNTLLKTILRDDWGFPGYVVSDCGAIRDIYLHHKIETTAPAAAALAVKAGTDLNCGAVYTSALIQAVHEGLLAESEIDRSVKRLLIARFRLGVFDPPARVPYTRIPIEENDSPAHRMLALQAARESIVLLKNGDHLLPLRRDLRRIAVIGPTADSYLMLLGNYNGTPSGYVTPLQGIRNLTAGDAEVVYEAGCDLVRDGAPAHPLSSELLSFDGRPGLKIESFRNEQCEGEPAATSVDPIGGANWSYWGSLPAPHQQPEFRSHRWSGLLTPPASGEYEFRIKADGPYRLIVGDSVLFDLRTNEILSERANRISLEQGKSYGFRLEFAVRSARPQLYVAWRRMDVDHFRRAVGLASRSDVVVFVGGITAQLEGEQMPVDEPGFKGGDRTSLDLPAVQERLLEAIQATGTPVVLVLTGGSALAVNWAAAHVGAIVQLWYPGEEGGNALADVLFGRYNPGGRLPVTFYRSVDQLPPFEDYGMRGRTYRYFEGEPLFGFGYGLSYTTFGYADLDVPDTARAGEELPVSVEVRNSGAVAGDEVVQLYVKCPAREGIPRHSLVAFRRIHLAPGERRTVKFTLGPGRLATIAESGGRIVEPGEYRITAGGTQPGTVAPTTGTLTKKVTITGSYDAGK